MLLVYPAALENRLVQYCITACLMIPNRLLVLLERVTKTGQILHRIVAIVSERVIN